MPFLTRNRGIKAGALCMTALCLCSCSMLYTTTVKPASSQTVEEQPLFVSAPSEDAKAPENSFLLQISKAVEKNRDTAGWLYIPGTDINNSVLQAFDNSYYIRRDEQRADNIYGCYFADCDAPLASAAELAPNTIIYGHSDLKDNPDGKRFSQLFKFTQDEFVKKTPNIYFSTSEEDLVWRVFAAFYTHTSFHYISTHPSETEFKRIVEKAREGSLYDYNVDVTADDRILTLSTCSVKHGTSGEYRFVVMARLLREGESFDEKLDTPQQNPDAKLLT